MLADSPERLKTVSSGLNELMQFLIEQGQNKTFGRVEFALNAGQIGVIKFEQHFKPGELPIRDKDRVSAAKSGSK